MRKINPSGLPTALVLLCLSVWTGTIGCTQETVIVDGVEREYALCITPDPAAAPWPVVFYFHGANESSLYAVNLFEEARRRNVLLVGMQGVEDKEFYFYNRGGGEHEPVTGWALSEAVNNEDHPDLRYFDAVLEALRAQFLLDDDRIHLAGFSMGACFIHIMAGYRSPVIASVVTSSGGIDAEGIANHCGEEDRGYCFVDPVTRDWKWLKKMERKYPVFLLHGEKDPLVPPDRSLHARDAYLRAGWSETESGHPVGAEAECRPDLQIRIVPGLVHDWPRGWNNRAGYNAFPEVFDFFASHSRHIQPKPRPLGGG
jgi:dienelactone hydrolase